MADTDNTDDDKMHPIERTRLAMAVAAENWLTERAEVKALEHRWSQVNAQLEHAHRECDEASAKYDAAMNAFVAAMADQAVEHAASMPPHEIVEVKAGEGDPS